MSSSLVVFVTHGIEWEDKSVSDRVVEAACGYARDMDVSVFGIFVGGTPGREALRRLVEDRLLECAPTATVLNTTSPTWNVHMWRTLEECRAALKVAHDTGCCLVFATTWAALHDIRTACLGELGPAYDDWFSSGRLEYVLPGEYRERVVLTGKGR